MDFVFLNEITVSNTMSETTKNTPKNAGAPWTSELDDEFLHMLSDNKSVEECANHFERTEGSITSRKMVIAKRMIANGEDIKKVSEIVKSSVKFIEQSIESEETRKQNAEKKRNEKKNTIQQYIQPKQEETSLSVLKEIRDLLKKLVD